MIMPASHFKHCVVGGLLAVTGGCVALWPLAGQAAGVITDGAAGLTALPTAPSGFYATPTAAGGMDAGFMSDLLDGLSLGTTLSGMYNSNVSPYSTTPDPTTTAKDDFILGLGGNLNYLSKGSGLTFGGNYRGNYNQYFTHTDYSGYSQGGGVTANYAGGRFSAAATVSMSVDRGSNLNYGSAFVEQTSLNTGLTARYKVSRKISLQGNLNLNSTTSGSGNYSGTNTYNLGLSALWKYSPLTEFGPGVHYTYTAGGNQLSRTSIGPILSVNYKLSSKVAMNSQVGMNFASYSNGATADPTLSAAIGMTYQASKLWGMDFSLYRNTQANPSQVGSFSETTSMRLGYHRKIRRAIFNAGISYNTYNYTTPGLPGGDAGSSQNNFSIDTSLGTLIFANTCGANVFVRFTEQSSGAASSWNSVQTGFSISRKF